MNIIITQQHAIDDRWIDIVNLIEKEFKDKIKIDKYYVFLSQKRYKNKIYNNMPKGKTEVIYIYENWVNGTVGPEEISKLRNWEKQIKESEFNLWRLTMPDRARGIPRMDEKDYYWSLYWHFNYFEQFIKTKTVDFLIGFTPENLPNYILYSIAKMNNIKCLFLEISRIWNGVYFYDNYLYNKDGIKEEYYDLLNRMLDERELEEAQKLKVYIEQTETPAYINLLKKKHKSKNGIANLVLEFFKVLFRVIRCKIVNYYYNEPYYYENINESFYGLKSKLRKKIIVNNYLGIFKEPDFSEDYFYFPLHYQPESTTSISTPNYMNNQLEVIRSIAVCLPIGFKLYVKEHPSMADVGYRPISFYKKLSKIFNVKLIDINTKSKQLIKNSKGVIVLSGSSGLESIISGKPTYIFANMFFADIPGLSWRVKGYMNLYDLLKHTDEFKPDEERILKFLASIEKVLYKGLNLFQKHQVNKEQYFENYYAITKILVDKLRNL